MSEREDGWRLETLAEAIADGFSNGNEQFNEASTAQQSRYIEAARAILALSAAPSPVDEGEELGGMIRQSVSAPESAAGEAEPSAFAGRSYNREAMQHAVNVFAEIVSSLALTPRQAEIAKAVIRAGIHKLNRSAAALKDASPLPLPEPGEGDAAQSQTCGEASADAEVFAGLGAEPSGAGGL